jgi:peptidoglycan/xylan/chitin deacetylase (PgdA/CDA1 family)
MDTVKHTMLRICLGLLKFTKMHRLLCPVFMGSGVILVLHRVVPEQSSPRIAANSRIEITPEFLEQLIEFFLHQGYAVISLDELYARLTGTGGGQPFVCFTFDDGYADVYDRVQPVFSRYQLPYAVYVISDFPDRKSILWWYMLEDLVLSQDRIRFRCCNKDYTFNTTGQANKESGYAAIRELFLAASPGEIGDRIEAVFSPYSMCSSEYDDLQMNWDQVKELARDPLVTIGAHTVHHYKLNQLTADQVRREISEGKERLEEMIQSPVHHFAYPFGSLEEAGRREYALAAECGFQTMTTVREGVIYPAHRRHLDCLPRVEITGRHQDLTLVDLRRCGLVSLLRNGFRIGAP